MSINSVKCNGWWRLSTPAQGIVANVNSIGSPGAHRCRGLALSVHVVAVCIFRHNRKSSVNTHSHLDLCYPGSFTDSNREGSRQRAAAQASFLTTAAQDGLQPDPRTPPDVRSANTLGSIDFVTGDTHQVDVHLIDIKGDLPHRLSGIGMKVYPAVLAYDGTDLLDWLDDASLVIHRHDRNQRSVGANGSFELLKINNAVLLDPKIGNIETLLLQLSARIEDTLVFLYFGVVSQILKGRTALWLTV